MSKKKPKKLKAQDIVGDVMGPGKTFLPKSPSQVKADQKKKRELPIGDTSAALLDAIASLAADMAAGMPNANAKVDTKCPNCKLRLTIFAKHATHCILCGHTELEKKPSIHVL